MSAFLNDLWSSVFTPGPTPTLLVATNATFAALQLLLGALLLATYSVHFAILSVLCGGLWWSINWFATELSAAQAKEDEAEKLRKRKQAEAEWRRKGEVGDSADDEGEDTEVEERGVGKGDVEYRPTGPDRRVRKETLEARTASGHVTQSAGKTTAAQEPQAASGAELRERRTDDASLDRSGEVSTDSEWERVSQEGEDR